MPPPVWEIDGVARVHYRAYHTNQARRKQTCEVTGCGVCTGRLLATAQVVGLISIFERLTGTFKRQRIGSRVGVLHPLATTLVWMKVGTLVWRIQNPVLASMKCFGKARAVNVPLDTGALVANPE
jgi:hypothetical protein